MPIYLARAECRSQRWHVVTYDISDPDHWSEIDAQPTDQPCSEVPQLTGIRRELYDQLLRPTTVGLLAPGGERITLALHPDGVSVLRHESAAGELIQQTCYGTGGRPPNQTTFGPIPWPSGVERIDCTNKPPR